MDDFLAARSIKEKLEEVRQILVAHPDRFSLNTAGAALEEVTLGLVALQAAVEESRRREEPISREDQQEISQLFSLSGRVSALYYQAVTLYG